MGTRVRRSINEPIRTNPDFAERWHGEDRGLVTSWEVGRKMVETRPELAIKANRGELPKLGWKGGVQFPPPKKFVEGKEQKYGTLHYLAEWQGLRSEDLDIDLQEEREIVCALTGIRVIFTGDLSRFRELDSEEAEDLPTLLE